VSVNYITSYQFSYYVGFENHCSFNAEKESQDLRIFFSFFILKFSLTLVSLITVLRHNDLYTDKAEKTKLLSA